MKKFFKITAAVLGVATSVLAVFNLVKRIKNGETPVTYFKIKNEDGESED